METTSFEIDLKEIKQRASKNLENGPILEDEKKFTKQLVEILNEVLATEILCTLRYRQHYHSCKGLKSEIVAGEFLEHANQEWDHVFKIAERITQLGGEPNFDPANLTKRSHADYTAPSGLKEMIRDNLIAERIAVQTYKQLIRWVGNQDPTTRTMLESILIQEEEHADDMADLLEDSEK